MTHDQAASIAASIDWNPTCLPGEERQTIVRQIAKQLADDWREQLADVLHDDADAQAAGLDPEGWRPAPERVAGYNAAVERCVEVIAEFEPAAQAPAASGDTTEQAADDLGAQAPTAVEMAARMLRLHLPADRAREVAESMAAAGVLADGRDWARIEKALELIEAQRPELWSASGRMVLEDIRATLTSTEETQ